MSMPEKLFTRCERIIDGESNDTPRYFVNVVVNYGEKIFDEKTREKIIQDCETKREQLRTYWSKMKRRVGDKYAREINRLPFWIDLPKYLTSLEDFQNALSRGVRGITPAISIEGAGELEDSYGSPQLREYLEKRSKEATVEFSKALENHRQFRLEMTNISNTIGQIRKTIKILTNFDSFAQSLQDVDYELVDRFRERQIRAKMGISRKIGEYNGQDL